MADDLQHRLDEARTQFAAKQYDAALKTLSTCPQDDAKVIHNTVICQYAARPTNYRGVLVKLDLPAIQRVKSLKTGQLTPTVVLQYEGQEIRLHQRRGDAPAQRRAARGPQRPPRSRER
jgi:hypothetical protein